MQKMAGKRWKRDELIIAFNLYCKISFGQIHNRNPKIIELAQKLGRSPSAVSWKLANFARLDPVLRERGIQGATHGSKAEEEVWNEFNNDWEKLAFQSEMLSAEIQKKDVKDTIDLSDEDKFFEGKEREALVKVRVNQNFFRQTVFAAYDFSCCITGLNVNELLIASHIIPWSIDKDNRVNPRNGLCLNAIHDRAFDRGLMSITEDYTIIISSRIKGIKENQALNSFLFAFEGKKIAPPKKFRPDASFLKYHREKIFEG